MGYQLIETIEVGAGGAASIEFTSIPQDGVDLLIVYSGRSGDATTYYEASVQFNNDTGDNYSWRSLLGNGSAASSSSGTNVSVARAGVITGASATSNTFGNVSTYVSNYTSSTAKSISVDGVTENNGTTSAQVIYAAVWTGTAAITSLKLTRSSVQYSTASLYKITAD